MRLFASVLILPVVAFFAVACSSNGGGGSSDPRCTSICAVEVPTSGPYCSQASADACLQECTARVAGTTTVCGDCLLQDASFGASTTSNVATCMSPSPMCPGDAACTEQGPGGSCTYCQSDPAQAQACDAMVNPPQEVSCSTDFRDPAKCSALCAM